MRLFKYLAASCAALISISAHAQGMEEKCNNFKDEMKYEQCLIKNGATWLSSSKTSFSIQAGNKKYKFLRDDSDNVIWNSYLGLDKTNSYHMIAATSEDFGRTILIDKISGNKIEMSGNLFSDGISPRGEYAVLSTYIEPDPCGPVIGVVKLPPKGSNSEEIEQKLPNSLAFCTDISKHQDSPIQKSFSAGPVKWQSNSSLLVNWECHISGKTYKKYNDKTILALNGNTWTIDHPPCNFGSQASPSASGITSGMKITGVRGDSAAAASGLRSGMFLLTLNNQAIDQVDDARRVNAQGQRGFITAIAIVNGQKRTFNIAPHTGTLGLDLCELSKCKP
jgi:hypothetical protein